MLFDDLWLADMVSFGRPILLILAGLALLLSIGLRWPVIVIAAVGFGFNAYAMTGRVGPVSPAAATSNLRILSANVLFDNSTPERFRDVVAGASPDIVVVQEAKFRWPAIIRSLDGYPNVAGPELSRWNGVLVASRFPVRSSLVPELPVGQRGGDVALRVEFEMPGLNDPVVLYAIHAPTPRTRAGWEERNLYLAMIAARAKQEPPESNLIVVGDWNTPVWSTTYGRFLETSGLSEAERSIWPANTRIFSGLGFGEIAGAAVDHVALSPGIGVLTFGVGPRFGSDHRPIIVDLDLK